MDQTNYFVYALSLLSMAIIVNMQGTPVSLTTSPERPRVGESVAMTCTVSGVDLSTDTILIRKLNNDMSILILMTSEGPGIALPDHWIPGTFMRNDDGSPGGTLLILTTSVTVSDMGDYACTILRDSAKVAEDKTHLAILYVPSGPLCFIDPLPQDNGNYYVGDAVTLSCVSDLGNPIVSLTWARDDGLSIPTFVTTISNFLTVDITVTMSLSDRHVLFTCTSRSAEYPDFQETCIVRIIDVVPPPTTMTSTTISEITTKPTTIFQTLSRTSDRGNDKSFSTSRKLGSETLVTTVTRKTLSESFLSTAPGTDKCLNCFTRGAVAAILTTSVIVIIGLLGVIFYLYKRVQKIETALKNKETSPSVVAAVESINEDPKYESRLLSTTNASHMELQKQGMENHAYASLQKEYETVIDNGDT